MYSGWQTTLPFTDGPAPSGGRGIAQYCSTGTTRGWMPFRPGTRCLIWVGRCLLPRIKQSSGPLMPDREKATVPCQLKTVSLLSGTCTSHTTPTCGGLHSGGSRRLLLFLTTDTLFSPRVSSQAGKSVLCHGWLEVSDISHLEKLRPIVDQIS